MNDDDDKRSFKFTFKFFLIIVALTIGWLLFFSLLAAVVNVFFSVGGPRGLMVLSLVMPMIGILYARLLLGSESW